MNKLVEDASLSTSLILRWELEEQIPENDEKDENDENDDNDETDETEETVTALTSMSVAEDDENGVREGEE